MKNLFLGLCLTLSTSMAFADVLATIPSSRAAELAAHRVEKLINLKKIDAAFGTKIQSMEVQSLNPGKAGDPAFLATVSQVAGTDGTKNQVEITMDDQGKSLSFKVNNGATAQNAPEWPKSDASTLIENSLHHLLDHGSHDAELKPFYDSLLSLKLKKVNKGSEEMAAVEMRAKDTQRMLTVFLKLDGTFVSHEIN